MRLRHSRGGVIHEAASFTNRRNRSDVSLENARLGQSGQALANRSRTTLTNALDGHQVLNVGGKELLEVLEVVDEPLDDRSRQAGHLGQESVAPGADCCIEGIAADSESDGLGTRGQVEQLDGRELHQVGQNLLDGAGVVGRFEVVADHQLAVIAQTTGQLLELKGQQPAVCAELDDVAVDLFADPSDHLEARQRAGDLIESRLVALESLQGLVGAGKYRARFLEDVAPAVDIQGDDLHGLAHRDHREAGLFGDPLCGAGCRTRWSRSRGRAAAGWRLAECVSHRARARWRRPSWPARAVAYWRTRCREGSRRSTWPRRPCRCRAR